MNGLEPLIPIFFFLTVGAVVILRGPLGRALADRIAGRAGPAGPQVPPGQAAFHEHAGAEIDELRQRMTELEERQDFTERVLAQHSDRTRLEGER
ncbi:MAG TPA: hypothetical protein VJ992_07840 [Gemmatimonadales bacterium]|nr:hypothetical protein [Gemmatimonadales bacterium]